LVRLPRKLFKIRERLMLILPSISFFPLLLIPGWNADVTSGAPTVILNYGLNLRMKTTG
jgi:hypothetical protein